MPLVRLSMTKEKEVILAVPLFGCRTIGGSGKINVMEGEEEHILVLINEMDRMIRNLYLNMIQDIEVTDDISEKLKREILKILEDHEKKISSQEYVQCRDRAFRIASVAEKTGLSEDLNMRSI